MTPLLFILIALGWLGVVWAWARDHRSHGPSRPGLGIAAPIAMRTGGPLAAPRTARMARRRRREVLVGLVSAALVSFLLARAWAGLWVFHLLIDGVLIAYLWAVFALERPYSVPTRPTISPVVHPDATGRDRPGPRRRPEPVLR